MPTGTTLYQLALPNVSVVTNADAVIKALGCKADGASCSIFLVHRALPPNRVQARASSLIISVKEGLTGTST
jgi:hypothetical protein